MVTSTVVMVSGNPNIKTGLGGSGQRFGSGWVEIVFHNYLCRTYQVIYYYNLGGFAKYTHFTHST